MNDNSVSLDRFDRHILEILQAEGRISNQSLAERVNLSPSPCLRRVRALEAAGLITGYRARIAPDQIGYGLNVVLHISMDQHTPERFAQFEAQIAELPEVQDCLLITGQEADYQLHIWAADMNDYQRLLLQHITRIPGVDGVHTSFVLRRILRDRVLPPRS
ncbi:Lrp/AsnC family transcriptional regulator [Salinisphaera sp. USBA-960]|uniref:Lrp/AsnC family transcriptional regulator n=1 Tax=Salinisphaera orenii TaxID=856731 RepID=UPI000DBE6740|nr:Lrp/AsnC family transcriptional regulator [Salifodinibacter halophilus]NNC26714.1 Lrp/AsnC family transcriptional regulator [Salifodinibacter halophilus]